MNVGHSNIYDRLAARAGAEAGLKRPTPASVAEDDAARERRDTLWAEFDRMLLDTQTYTLGKIRTWLADQGIVVSVPPVHRCRHRKLDEVRRVTLAIERTRQTMALLADMDEGEVLTAARKRAAQILFDQFMRLGPDALDSLSPGQIIGAIEVAGRLAKGRVESDLLEQRLAGVRKAFDAQVDAASRKTADGRLSAEDLADIRRAVFGSAA
ncbi:MAG: DUF3486 family protein [Planctomycetes bacterium]|nr:DUF3486 family protein [Planctomycetota bacterium]